MSKTSQLFEDAKKRGVPDEMFTVNLWSGSADQDFLKRKHKIRKKYPDIAKRWDDTFPGGIDPNMEDYQSASEDFTKTILFVIGFLVFAFMGLMAATNGSFGNDFAKNVDKLNAGCFKEPAVVSRVCLK